MKPWELLGWGMLFALGLYVAATIVAIPIAWRIIREARRNEKEMAGRIAEQRATIRRQRGRFKL